MSGWVKAYMYDTLAVSSPDRLRRLNFLAQFAAVDDDAFINRRLLVTTFRSALFTKQIVMDIQHTEKQICEAE